MTRDDLFRALAKMESCSRLTESAEILLHLLIEGADTDGKAGEADLERWKELAQVPQKSLWTASFAAIKELKEKGFVRGYFGNSVKGAVRATFADELLEAALEAAKEAGG